MCTPLVEIFYSRKYILLMNRLENIETIQIWNYQTQQANTFSKSTWEILEYQSCSKLAIKTPKRLNWYCSCFCCQIWEYLAPFSNVPIIFLEQVNVCWKPVAANLWLREQRDLYLRYNCEHVSNHIPNSVFLL